MTYRPELVTGPASGPLTLAEAKEHLRVEHDEDDALITAYMNAALDNLEGTTGILGGRALVTQTWTQQYGGFSSPLSLPFSPTASIASITYPDADGVTQTLAEASYSLEKRYAGDVVRIIEQPSTNGDPITVSFIAGYGDADAVPAAIKAAMLLHIGTLYENREKDDYHSAVNDMRSYETLIDPYRRLSV